MGPNKYIFPVTALVRNSLSRGYTRDTKPLITGLTRGGMICVNISQDNENEASAMKIYSYTKDCPTLR